MRAVVIRILVSALFLFAPAVEAGESDYRVTRQDLLSGNIQWDYLAYEEGSKRLFITRGDHVDIYDTSLNRVVASIPDTPGVHGVALAPDLDKGFTSNGRNDTVSLFKLSSLKVLGSLPTGKNPDAIVYDRHTRRVFAANGKSGDLTVIDAVLGRVLATIVIGGKLEFAAVDGKGRLYVNIEDKNALVVVDTVDLAVLARYDLSPGCNEPTGLAIDPATERLFVGCHNQKMLVVSGASGDVLASVPIGKGCDATAYDSSRKLVFSSNGEGSVTIISADTYTVKQTLSTQATARTLALDGASHHLYTVAAEMEPPSPAGGRPTLKRGTFSVITISP